MRRSFFKLVRDRKGTFAVETAVVAPVLAMMGLGIFEVGSMVARQHELQTAASEGEAIALTVARGATVETTEIEDIIEESVGLPEGSVTVSRFYRCDADIITVSDPSACEKHTGSDNAGDNSANGDKVVSSYIRIVARTTYNPVWTSFGVGKQIDFNIDRTVQLS